jgi:hypothetical protein
MGDQGWKRNMLFLAFLQTVALGVIAWAVVHLAIAAG